MQSQWFVIHTLSGQEQKVKESIEKRIKPEEMGDYIKEVLVPMEGPPTKVPATPATRKAKSRFPATMGSPFM